MLYRRKLFGLHSVNYGKPSPSSLTFDFKIASSVAHALMNIVSKLELPATLRYRVTIPVVLELHAVIIFYI